MELLRTARRWQARIDRERVDAFSRFLVRRFVDDRCFESAGALAYTTMFALVPLAAVVFGVLSAFPAFDSWTNAVVDFVFRNFVPASAHAIEGHLREYASAASRLTAVGVA